MRFWRLEAEWDDDNVRHISRLGVEPEEVEEIVYEDCYRALVVRARRRGLGNHAGLCSGKRVEGDICSRLSRHIPNAASGVR